MVLISFTNILVDDFSYAKRNPLKRYLYFLTHMHSDHYQGISNAWDYGPVFCSQVTKAILYVKFPKLVAPVTALPMKTPNEIVLSQNRKCRVTLLDSNHCPGSVMILFQGYFGTILHTGDMRFNMEMIYQNPILYPPEKQVQMAPQQQHEDSEFYVEAPIQTIDACSIQVDELILDNTYCDPVFKFPNRDEAFRMICEIIDKYVDIRVLLCVDSVGKEELMVQLSQHYKTLIVVNEQRFEIVHAINYHTNLFTTNRTDGWIEVIRKGEVHERLKEKNTIAITATGWANTTSYQMPDNRKYVIPYSLHSNFNEMHQFVRSIRPCIIQKVVKNRCGKSDKIYNITAFSQYMVTLHYLKQRGFEFFQQHYADETKLSSEYKNIMCDVEQLRKINTELGLTLNAEDQKYADTTNFEEKYKNIFQAKKKVVKGVKLKSPEKNSNFKITQFIRTKKQVDNEEKSRQTQVHVVSDSSCKRKDTCIETTSIKIKIGKQIKQITPIVIDGSADKTDIPLQN